MSNLPSQMLRGSERFHREWMLRSTLGDTDGYRARPLIEAIIANLSTRGATPGISQIFFGHDDVPAVSQWVSQDQAGRVFPADGGGDGPESTWGTITPITPFFRTRTLGPPKWGRTMHIRDGRDATVIRLDDVGRSGSRHGFHLVTVDPAKEPPWDVVVEWIEIPG